jgi:ATP-binding cassette subfamily C protein CydD
VVTVHQASTAHDTRSIDARILACSPTARRLLQLTVASGFIAAGLLIVQALLLARIIAGVFIDHETLSQVASLLVLLLAVASARAGALYFSEIAAQRSASLLKGALLADLLRHLDSLGPLYLRRQQAGDLVSVASQGVEDLDEYYAAYQPLRRLVVLVPVFVALVIFVIDPLSALVVLLTGPVLVLLLIVIGSRTSQLAERRLQELNWLSAHFLDMLQGLTTLKLFGRSREQVGNIRTVSREYGHTAMDVLRTAFETTFVLELSATIATALVAVETGLRLARGNLAFETALVVLLITPEFFAPLRQLAARYHAGATGRAAAGRIFAVLDTPLPSTPKMALPASYPATNGHRVSPASGDIRFDQVSATYDGRERPALTGISFTIPAGATTALVGASGAGKTTAANLLLRFLEAEGGTISVGNTPLTSIPKDAWREQVAWVPQQPHLFARSVTENIRIARLGATAAEVADAAVAAQADGFIRRLPRGYDTVLTEHAASLSGGERQRLALARAFLKDAPFVILDEPTSHLDAENEALLSEAIERLSAGRTTLLIAHRMALVECADQVVLLQHGRVIESGTHAALLFDSPAYRELFATTGSSDW